MRLCARSKANPITVSPTADVCRSRHLLRPKSWGVLSLSKGKPAVRRGRKASGLLEPRDGEEIAGLPAQGDTDSPAVNRSSDSPSLPSCFAALGINIFTGVVRHMHILDVFARPRSRPAAALCGLMALAVAFDASAYHRWRQYQVTISGSPSTNDVTGQAYSFQPTASGPTGYTLTFAISGKPAWASFDSSTGRLTGTPTSTNVGTYSNIVISVTDGPSTASLAPFSISVTSPDVASISGQPSTSVNVGAAYSFTPTATDSAGKPLTFSIQNPPSWASFNSVTGQLAGSPTATYAGTYSNIVISASDGTAQAALPAFSITVNQVSNGTATITWTPPLYNVDGSALTNLAGYRIYYGTATNSLNQSVQVANVGAASYTVSNLTSGTWYFGVTAYSTSGLESALSNLASKTVQ